MTGQTVSVTLTANTAGFNVGLSKSAQSAKTTAESIKGSFSDVDKIIAKSATASVGSIKGASAGAQTALDSLTRARLRAGDASRTVAIAEARLNELQTRGRSGTAAALAAEDRLIKSRRAAAEAQSALTAATSDYDHALNGSVGLSRMGQGLDRIAGHSAELDHISGSLMKIGAVGGLALGAAAKSAMDWESAWTGVTKTVDGSAAQMANLEGSLRGLAKTLPASHEEIAAVAEAAGQLGVQRDSIVGFTKTMIDLGESTNLSADEAATSIAQMMNVMGTAPQDVGRLGASLVALGNDGASTERDIIEMAQRISGAGRQVGMSESDVLAYSNALASVGINAEAGGTAISTSFLKIDQAVRDGGSKLDLLAKTAGMSGSAFRQAFQHDAAGAMNSFVVGLGKVQAEGGDTTAILRDLGIRGIRESDALRRLASSGTLLADSLKLGNQAWKDNTALVNEASKRYATTESQVRIAWNQIKDAAITGGQAILPIVAQLATGAAKLAEIFGDIPGPARNVGAALVVTGTAMALIGGGSLKAVTGLAQLRTSLSATAAASAVAGRAMKVAQLSIPVVGVALFAASVAAGAWASKASVAGQATGELATAMQTVEGNVTAATAAMNENVRAATVNSLMSGGAADAAKQLGLSLTTVTDAALGNKDALAQVQDAISGANQRMLEAQKLQGNSMGAPGVVDGQVKAAKTLGEALGVTTDQIHQQVTAEQDRRAAMDSGTGSAKSAADAAKQHAQALEEEEQKLKAAADAAQHYANQILQMSGSQIGMESAIDAATAAAKKNGDTLDVNTAQGRANQQALNSIAAATLQYTNQMVTAKEPVDRINAANERGKAKWIETAVAMGKSRTAAKDLADTLFAIPDNVTSQVVVSGAKVSAKDANTLNKAMKDIPAEKRAQIITIAETKGAKAAKQAIAEIKAKRVEAKVIGDIKGARSVDAAMRALKNRLVRAEAKGDKRGADIVKAAMAALKNKTVNAKALPSGEGGVRSLKGAVDSLHNKTVTVSVRYSGNRRGLATGGLVTPVGLTLPGPVHRSDGGPVWGAGTATSDSIPAMLSNGEFVINARSVHMIGSHRLAHMNATGTLPTFANGGPVGLAVGGPVGGFVSGSSADISNIVRLIAALTRPLAGVVSAQSVLAKETRDVSAARRQLASAKKKKGKAGKKAQSQAKSNLDKQVGELKDATKNLRDAEQAVADSARQKSATMAEPYRSSSTDINDWLESMKQGASDLNAFQTDLAKLRKMGLSETIVQQIADKGAIVGHELADQILDGGTAIRDALNKANGNLQKAADKVGFAVVTATGRYSVGGFVSGPGTGTSDSINAKLSNGEYVVNARATSMYGSVLDAINNFDYGPNPRFLQPVYQSYAGGGYVSSQVSHSKQIRGGDMQFSGDIYVVDPDEFLRKSRQALTDSLNSAALRL